MRLYKVICRGMRDGLGVNVAHGIAYVVAEHPTAAYARVRDSLDERGLGFDRDRELQSVELIADEYEYADCGYQLYLPWSEAELEEFFRLDGEDCDCAADVKDGVILAVRRERADAQHMADRYAETMAENRLLREAVDKWGAHEWHYENVKPEPVDVPLTAAEVERVKKLEKVEDKASVIREYECFEASYGKMGADLDAALAELEGKC